MIRSALAVGFTCLLASAVATAAPVSVSQTQPITADNQAFTFTFAPLPASDGAGGQLRFLARGDYTDGFSEFARIQLESVPGLVDLIDLGVAANSISGFTLALNNTVAGGDGVDQTLDFTFDFSAALLSGLLADGAITVFVTNSSTVNAQLGFEDFTSVSITYNSAATAVPIPGTLALVGIGLAGLGLQRRFARGMNPAQA